MLDAPTPIDLESLKLLEARVEQFVTQHERAREENEVLQARLDERDRQLAEASAELRRYERERTELRARLERLLSRLNTLDLS